MERGAQQRPNRRQSQPPGSLLYPHGPYVYPIAHWTFDNTVADQTKNHHDGVITGDVTYSNDVPSVLGSGKSLCSVQTRATWKSRTIPDRTQPSSLWRTSSRIASLAHRVRSRDITLRRLLRRLERAYYTMPSAGMGRRARFRRARGRMWCGRNDGTNMVVYINGSPLLCRAGRDQHSAGSCGLEKLTLRMAVKRAWGYTPTWRCGTWRWTPGRSRRSLGTRGVASAAKRDDDQLPLTLTHRRRGRDGR